MRGKHLALVSLALAASITLLSPAFAQGAGSKQKLSGVIIKQDADSFVLRTGNGMDQKVKVTLVTEIKEKKKNPFRSAREYAASELLRSLKVEVEGRLDDSGVLVAKKIRFTNDDLELAHAVEGRVAPVETRVGKAEARMTASEKRLAQSEDNAERLAGQIEELNTISNAAHGEAKAAQQTADDAVAAVQATNQRIAALDDYQLEKSVTVQFKAGSAFLSMEAKDLLDELAAYAETQKGFVIEIAGFASADGSEELNRRLSQRRAEAVSQYLAENHDIPLRRMIIPFGYGESHPVADNSTRQGREGNRRVEVRVLVNRGLTMTTEPQANLVKQEG